MDKATKQKIESFAWDCTIGNGRAEEFADTGHEPGSDEFTALSRVLGHFPTKEEQDAFCAAWDKNLQCAMQW